MKFCVFRVIDNKAFEDVKEFKILLKSNISLLASPYVAKIFISDVEDGLYNPLWRVFNLAIQITLFIQNLILSMTADLCFIIC